jgi:hypothetical protein
MLVNSGNKYFSVLLLFGAFEKVVQEFFIGINARFCRSKETRGRIEIREMFAGRASGRDEHGGELQGIELVR